MGAHESVVIIIENCTLGYKLPGFLDRYFLSVRCRSLSPSFPACAAGFCLKRPYGLTCELGLCAASIVLVHQILPLRLYIDLFVCVFFCLAVPPFSPAHCPVLQISAGVACMLQRGALPCVATAQRARAGLLPVATAFEFPLPLRMCVSEPLS